MDSEFTKNEELKSPNFNQNWSKIVISGPNFGQKFPHLRSFWKFRFTSSKAKHSWIFRFWVVTTIGGDPPIRVAPLLVNYSPLLVNWRKNFEKIRNFKKCSIPPKDSNSELFWCISFRGVKNAIFGSILVSSGLTELKRHRLSWDLSSSSPKTRLNRPKIAFFTPLYVIYSES